LDAVVAGLQVGSRNQSDSKCCHISHHQILMMTAAGVAELAVGALMIGALSPS